MALGDMIVDLVTDLPHTVLQSVPAKRPLVLSSTAVLLIKEATPRKIRRRRNGRLLINPQPAAVIFFHTGPCVALHCRPVGIELLLARKGIVDVAEVEYMLLALQFLWVARQHYPIKESHALRLRHGEAPLRVRGQVVEPTLVDKILRALEGCG
jgi:hypothetical protein